MRSELVLVQLLRADSVSFGDERFYVVVRALVDAINGFDDLLHGCS
jgi:hypothetical protein